MAGLDHAGLVGKVIDLLEERYIFEDVAAQMVARLREKLPGYTALNDPAVFAKTVTEDMQAISRDKHLHMDHDPAGAAQLLGLDADDRASRVDAWIEHLARQNFGFHRVEWLPGRVGYLDLRAFPPPEAAGEVAAAAMRFLERSQALIFDLRKNGGGSPLMVQFLITYLYSEDDFIKHLNSFYIRHSNESVQFWTLPYVPGKRMANVDVYVLTSPRTFSGAEEFTYNLKAMKRATIIGETTGGGANPGDTHALDTAFTIFIPDGRAINPITGTNWEGVGITPDIEVPADDALRVAHMTALERLLEKAASDDDRAALRRELDTLKNASA